MTDATEILQTVVKAEPIEVWTVTVMDDRDKEHPAYDRTPLICTTRELARLAVEQNDLDIAEGGTNRWAIIEKSFLNVNYPKSEDRQFYEWDEENERYIKCDIPPQYQRVYSFGIG